MKHGKTICDANRPKDLEEYDFEVSERLRETLVPQWHCPRYSFGHGSSSIRRVCRLFRLEIEFFSELEPEKIFSFPGTLQSLPRETRTQFLSL